MEVLTDEMKHKGNPGTHSFDNVPEFAGKELRSRTTTANVQRGQLLGSSTINRSQALVRDDSAEIHLVSSIATGRQLRGNVLRMRYRDGFRLASSIILI